MKRLGLLATLALACATPPPDVENLPVDLQPGASVAFDRGYVSQTGIPGFTTDMYRGLRVVDLAQRGDDRVLLLNESWLSSATFSNSDPGHGGVLLPNSGGGSNATFFRRSSDAGSTWTSFRPSALDSLGGISGLGWHLTPTSWLFVYLDPTASFNFLRRYEPGGAAFVADPSIDGHRLQIGVTATPDWFSGWGYPFVLGGRVFESMRMESDTVFIDRVDLDGDPAPLPYIAFDAAAASADGQRWFALAPTRPQPGACRLEMTLAAGPKPRTPVTCIDELEWSAALKAENWPGGADDSRSFGALLSWGPTAIFSHAGVVWAYPMDGDLDASRARRLSTGRSMPDTDARVHARFDHAATVEGLDGVRRYFDVNPDGSVVELRFPANPCVPGGACGGGAELVWAARLPSGEYQLYYLVDRTQLQSADKHPVLYAWRVAVERVPVASIAPPVGPDLGSTPEKTPTALERACFAAASCGLRLPSGTFQGPYATLKACTRFFTQRAPTHPRRRAFETAPFGACATLLAAWEERDRPIVDPSACARSCDGTTLVGCDASAHPLRHDCALEFRRCGTGPNGAACLPPTCAADGVTCDGARNQSCWAGEVAATTDCGALTLSCDPVSPQNCLAASPASDTCAFLENSRRTDEQVRCLGGRYLTWCAAVGVQRTLDCRSEGAAGCEDQCGSQGPGCTNAQGLCR